MNTARNIKDTLNFIVAQKQNSKQLSMGTFIHQVMERGNGYYKGYMYEVIQDSITLRPATKVERILYGYVSEKE